MTNARVRRAHGLNCGEKVLLGEHADLADTHRAVEDAARRVIVE